MTHPARYTRSRARSDVLGRAIVAELERGPALRAELIERTGRPLSSVNAKLVAMVAENVIHRIASSNGFRGRIYTYHNGPMPEQLEAAPEGRYEQDLLPVLRPKTVVHVPCHRRDPMVAALFGAARR